MIDRLRHRFIFVVMALFTGLLLAVCSSIYFLMAQSETRQSVRILEDAFRMTAQEDRRDPPEASKNTLDQQNEGAKQNNLMRNTILLQLNTAGSLTGVHYQFEERETDWEALAQASETIQSDKKENGSVTIDEIEYRFLKRNTSGGLQIALLDRSIELVTLQRLLFILLLIGVGAWLAFLLISVFLSRWAVRPTAEAWKRQRQFVADASHELKTPLTVIDANLDVALANPEDTVGSQSKWLKYCKTECARMTKLVHDLLYLAKSDDPTAPMERASFNFSEVVTGVCLAFETLVFEAGKQMEAHIEACVSLTGDPDRCKQLITILLDNALTHSDDHGKLSVSLKREHGKKIRLDVYNTGKPISSDQQVHIFERFYRTDFSRARTTGGYGLGLAIAKTIVQQHGGSISVKSIQEGTTFTVLL